MNIRVQFAGLLFSFLFAFSTIQAAENDFDKVCDYFKELAKKSNVNSMTHLQRNNYILERINKNLPTTSNARVAWEAVSNAESDQRYELFKSSAELVLNSRWKCKAMAELANKTGEF